MPKLQPTSLPIRFQNATDASAARDPRWTAKDFASLDRRDAKLRVSGTAMDPGRQGSHLLGKNGHMTLAGIGIISRVQSVTLAQVSRVAAALAQQVTQHVCPAWELPAPVVQAYPSLGDVPQAFGVLFLMADIADAFFGFHRTVDGRPVAFVRNGETWSLYASHEAVEMTIDPVGTMFLPGPSPVAGQGEVEFLVEACDPVQDTPYHLGGQVVSDFCLPAFYTPNPTAGAPLTHSASLVAPFSVGRDSYITWRFQGDFWQLDRFGANPNAQNLGLQNPVAGSYRAALDRLRPETSKLSRSGHRRPVKRLLAQAKDESVRHTSYADHCWRELHAFQKEQKEQRRGR